MYFIFFGKLRQTECAREKSCIAYKDRQNSAAIIRDRLANACMGCSGLCVVQVVRLVTMHITSPAATRASLIRWFCIISDGLPRESMDWMVAVTLVYWFKDLRAHRQSISCSIILVICITMQ